MFRGGYLGKLLRVNLSRKTARVEPIGEERLRLLLGGRALAAKYYYEEIGLQTQAFDEANKLFFFSGPLTRLALPSTTKFQPTTRSPETRRYLCSTCGGNFGPRLKMAGFDALIIEGQAAEWTYLLIRDGEVSFADARPWQGWTTDRTLEGLYQAIGDSRGICTVVREAMSFSEEPKGG